jgi:hypothetical protein
METEMALPDVIGGGNDKAQAELLLYDYYKHMTTLILATLGGILSISQLTGIAVPIRQVLPALVLLLLAGVTALYAMDGMINARLRDKPTPPWVSWARHFVSGGFGLGIGAFLGRATDLIG